MTGLLVSKKTEHISSLIRSTRSLSTSVVEDPRSAPFHLRQSGIHPDDRIVEGLRMNRMSANEESSNQPNMFSHRPVMIDEIVEWFTSAPAGVFIDATLGGAGHSTAILDACPQLKLLGIDQDDVAIAAATERLARFGDRAALRRVRFDQLREAAAVAYPDQPITAILFDLGVSSPQLDVAERGFSYRQDGPLDMRMDRRRELSASVVVNDYDLNTLTDILRDGGEEKFARRIARAIVDARPLHTTNELAEVVRNATPAAARRRPGDPAKRSFQAIRLEVNAEIDVLATALDEAIDVLAPMGRLVTLAYHSGEDRLIKERFAEVTGLNDQTPPGMPIAPVSTARFSLLNRGSRKPGAEELSQNSRSESARLRGIFAHSLGDS